MAVTEKQLANLKPPVKGEIRNPKGKPKGTLSAKTVIKKWLKAREEIINPFTGKKQKITVLDVMTLAIINKARTGNIAAYNTLMDRLEGKPLMRIKQTDEMPETGNEDEDQNYIILSNGEKIPFE